FMADRTIARQRNKVTASRLHEALNEWCEETGCEPITITRMGCELKRLGIKKDRTGTRGATVYHGIGLKDDEPCMNDQSIHITTTPSRAFWN
ncbi:MAG: hypothetical protein ACR2PI_28270, partial [Hyphomicrobiaceae bacterium]